jgi:sterol desaturase/sphingolipid hydroxylase (fatty acid hydroxylase superfamily)
MTLEPWLDGLRSIGAIAALMALVALVEVAVPLRKRSERHRAHIGPNLALTAIAFGTNLVMNVALVSALVWMEARGLGLLRMFDVHSVAATIAAIAALDLATYGAHVAMHKVPFLWRLHRVHHSDPVLDVTSSIRQHPGESAWRYLALAACAIGLGVGPGAFAVYRVLSAVTAIFEHANVRVPLGVDRVLSLVTTWPGVHKIHHSRDAALTDTNYGNVLSSWDRLFGTFTPVDRVAAVEYGLDGEDDPKLQTTAALLATPFRPSPPDAAPLGSFQEGCRQPLPRANESLGAPQPETLRAGPQPRLHGRASRG